MNAWRHIRGFFRALRRRPTGVRPHAPTSLARTLRESTHAAGAHGGMSRASTEQQHTIVADGHEHYDASFDKD